MKNSETFVKSIHSKIESLKTDDYYCKEEYIDNLLRHNINRDYEDITDYNIAFLELFQDNEKIYTQIDKYKELLSEQKYFRQDVSSFVVLSMIRELRPPEEDKSKWQLLYETTLFPTNESGPILHLYFDGWEIINHKIYYFDEMWYYDVSEEEEKQQIHEDDIYKMITKSAKTRFDYQTFRKNFKFPDLKINVADEILWQMLFFIAIGEKPEIVSLKIMNYIITLGFFIENKYIEEIIINNQDNWKKELCALRMATGMLNSNFASIVQVYDFVCKMLKD